MAGPIRLPEAPSALLAPVALAKEFLKGPLVAGEGVADRRQQGKQLGWAAIFHRRAGQ